MTSDFERETTNLRELVTASPRIIPYELLTDGRTVWVNGDDGVCWGRFSRFGIDVHHNAEGQRAGKACLECVPGEMGRQHWDQFVVSMRKHHNVVVPEKYMPVWLRATP
jgi:hypothetical protein